MKMKVIDHIITAVSIFCLLGGIIILIYGG